MLWQRYFRQVSWKYPHINIELSPLQNVWNDIVPLVNLSCLVRDAALFYTNQNALIPEKYNV
ncbi:hypothetical protein GALL_26550 [mine drainage metagenome]|uniref:Uncharacterized protein n=1 Tax=mine drainage metagenome TaxID=410659 RepID=A0A1J5T9N0_9ZZZZ